MTIHARFHQPNGTFTLDADLSAPSRGVTALFGPSGCGKTTLLRAVAGLERIPGGYLEVGGEVWQDGDRFTPVHRRALGFVFQESSLFAHLTVRGNLEYARKRVQGRGAAVSLERSVDLLGLGGLLERRVDGLSGGERQRASMARALLSGPRLLLMDEPLASLDAESKREILPFLDQLHRELEIPVLYVSHAADEVARLADHLAYMDSGRIVAVGPVAHMLTRLDLPPAQGADAESVLDAEVAGRDEDDGIAELGFAGGVFHVAGTELPVGARVRLRVLARDVSLALERATGTSILNVLPAEVVELRDEPPAQVLVKLDCGGAPLLARVTRRSRRALGLETGQRLFAQVKTVALLS